MGKKIFILLEILVVLIISVCYIVLEVIPEYKKNLGSSDYFIETENYLNMIELKVGEVDFAVILDNDEMIYHIFFLNEKALCLYNKEVEDNSISRAIEKIVKILIESNYLSNTSTFEVTRYGENYYKEFKKDLLKILTKYDLNTNILESSSTLGEKAKSLEINSGEEEEKILRNIDYYSKEYSRNLNNNVDRDNAKLTEENGLELTKMVYKKIEGYIKLNRIDNLQKNNTEYVITMVAADINNRYYPSSNSWYYVKDGKVYAYIEIVSGSKKFGYCYNGSIDLYKKGEC